MPKPTQAELEILYRDWQNQPGDRSADPPSRALLAAVNDLWSTRWDESMQLRNETRDADAMEQFNRDQALRRIGYAQALMDEGKLYQVAFAKARKQFPLRRLRPREVEDPHSPREYWFVRTAGANVRYTHACIKSRRGTESFPDGFTWTQERIALLHDLFQNPYEIVEDTEPETEE